MLLRRSSLLLSAVSVIATACGDSDSPMLSTAPKLNTTSAPEALGLFHRFVSIGTSVSMGFQSDGAVAAGQQQSWTAQLAQLAGRDQSLPLIEFPGCRSPFAAPLASGKRLSGEGAGAAPASFGCAANEVGVTLPAQNVAVAGARTSDALNATPESKAGDADWGKLYTRILPPNTTQLAAALAQKPKFISVELGANEVLGAVSGIAVPGASLVPFSVWAPQYTTLADAVATEVDRGILVGLVDDVASFPSFRRGEEIWADRATMLAAFNVNVNANCDGNTNLIFVPVRIPTAVGTGAFYRANGLGAFNFSCADGGQFARDYVLTPAESAVVNTQLASMNEHIIRTAAAHGYAYMALQSLYGRSDIKPAFSSLALMTSATPYGAAVSLDGLHPSQLGHGILAAAAARAINARYGLNLAETPAEIALR